MAMKVLLNELLLHRLSLSCQQKKYWNRSFWLAGCEKKSVVQQRKNPRNGDHWQLDHYNTGRQNTWSCQAYLVLRYQLAFFVSGRLLVCIAKKRKKSDSSRFSAQQRFYSKKIVLIYIHIHISKKKIYIYMYIIMHTYSLIVFISKGCFNFFYYC